MFFDSGRKVRHLRLGTFFTSKSVRGPHRGDNSTGRTRTDWHTAHAIQYKKGNTIQFFVSSWFLLLFLLLLFFVFVFLLHLIC